MWQDVWIAEKLKAKIGWGEEKTDTWWFCSKMINAFRLNSMSWHYFLTLHCSFRVIEWKEREKIRKNNDDLIKSSSRKKKIESRGKLFYFSISTFPWPQIFTASILSLTYNSKKPQNFFSSSSPKITDSYFIKKNFFPLTSEIEIKEI